MIKLVLRRLFPINWGLTTLLAVGCALVTAPTAHARIVRLKITAKESPTFGGYSFEGVGQYEKIVGRAFGELDPNDPKNRVIIDLALAPRNANGKVEYSFDFYILKPVDLNKGNHKMMYEPPNRGSKTYAALNRGPGGNDPGSATSPEELAQTFLLPRGYTMAWSGWDVSAQRVPKDFNTTITVPVARSPNGSSITGRAYEYIVTAGQSYEPSYAAATTDRSQARLTHRVHLDDVPQDVPATRWTYNADGTAISLCPRELPSSRTTSTSFPTLRRIRP
jgi:hypothetical protein